MGGRQERTARGKMSRRDPSSPLTQEEHRVGPNDEVREVQPLDDVVIEAGALEPPGVVFWVWVGGFCLLTEALMHPELGVSACP